MRILQITAGAAGMYCGSCLRDNALASELKALGHDVLLLPVYTPTLTDEPNASHGRVFLGGISVTLQQRLALFRKTPGWLDRLWDSGPVLRWASRRGVSNQPRFLGDLTVSTLRGEEGFQRKEIAKLLAWTQELPPPDIVTLPNSLLIGLARPLRRVLKRPLCCTLQGEDLFLEGLPEEHRRLAWELIRSQVEEVDAFLPVSEFHARSMGEKLAIPAAKLRVTPLGVNVAAYPEREKRRRDTFTVGYLARIAPEKGLLQLCRAYIEQRKQGFLEGSRLAAAGYLAPDHRNYLDGVRADMEQAGLGGEFQYHGAIGHPEKLDFLRRLDLLCVPTTYDEPKGLFALEAMAVGVPVVLPRRGAFPELIGKAGGGILIEPDDPAGLGRALRELHDHPETAAALGRKGASGVREFFTSRHMAEATLRVYDQLRKG